MTAIDRWTWKPNMTTWLPQLYTGPPTDIPERMVIVIARTSTF